MNGTAVRASVSYSVMGSRLIEANPKIESVQNRTTGRGGLCRLVSFEQVRLPAFLIEAAPLSCPVLPGVQLAEQVGIPSGVDFGQPGIEPLAGLLLPLDAFPAPVRFDQVTAEVAGDERPEHHAVAAVQFRPPQPGVAAERDRPGEFLEWFAELGIGEVGGEEFLDAGADELRLELAEVFVIRHGRAPV